MHDVCLCRQTWVCLSPSFTLLMIMVGCHEESLPSQGVLKGFRVSIFFFLLPALDPTWTNGLDELISLLLYCPCKLIPYKQLLPKKIAFQIPVAKHYFLILWPSFAEVIHCLISCYCVSPYSYYWLCFLNNKLNLILHSRFLAASNLEGNPFGSSVKIPWHLSQRLEEEASLLLEKSF